MSKKSDDKFRVWMSSVNYFILFINQHPSIIFWLKNEPTEPRKSLLFLQITSYVTKSKTKGKCINSKVLFVLPYISLH